MNKPNPTAVNRELLMPEYEVDLTHRECCDLGFDEDDSVTVFADIKLDEDESGRYPYARNAFFKVNGQHVECGEHEEFALNKAISSWICSGQFD